MLIERVIPLLLFFHFRVHINSLLLELLGFLNERLQLLFVLCDCGLGAKERIPFDASLSYDWIVAEE